MKITKRNEMKIVESDLGYMLYDEKNDIYSQKIYLGINASVENYTEIKMTELDIRIHDAITENEEALRLQDETMNVIMLAMDELYKMIETLFKS